MTDFLEKATELFGYAQRLRRDFHRHPELGFQEVRTAGVVARELSELGLEVANGIGKTGVVGLLEGARPGPTLLVRFDMDALPIDEQTGAEYSSQNPGIMHACGHDGHVAIGLTAARLLTDHKDELAGTIKFVFQPAEEGMGGAEAMIADGVLDNPAPVNCLGLHLWNEKPLGWIGISPGPVMAGAEKFRIRIQGKGGHGAIPHLSVDPVLAGAQIISALQSIVARNIPPLQSAVVSVTTFHGGEAFNVIPQSVELSGTIRTFELSVREVVLKRFEQIVHGIADSMGCHAEIEMVRLTPAVINDENLANTALTSATAILPGAQLETSNYTTMGSEDFAFIMEKIPGCFMFIGSANPEKGLDAGHHHPRFDFDERALVHGAALMAATAADLLRQR